MVYLGRYDVVDHRSGRHTKPPGDQKYLDHAKAGFDFVWNGDPTINRVGSFAPPRRHGMGLENKEANGLYQLPYRNRAMTLYNITKDEQYVQKAKPSITGHGIISSNPIPVR